MKIFIFSLFIFCLSSSPALANTSPKKGAGQDYRYPMTYCNTTDVTNPCVVNYMNKVKSLGVGWLYLWGLTEIPAWLDTSIEFVPMIFDHGTNSDSSYAQGMLDWYRVWAKAHPGSHWLIWNEPDLNSTIPPLVAARIYKPLYNAIKDHELGDPTAKIIVGGLYDINFSANSWIQTFRNEYKRLNGDFPPLDGWAFHYYKTYSLNGFRDTINSVKSWYADNANGYSGKEFWLTEFGNLSSNEIGLQMLKDQQEWLETEPFVTRYAFFYTGVESNQKGNLLTGSTANLGVAQLSTLGLEYAKHPLNTPTPSPSPTSSICGSIVNSACCSTHTCQSSSGLYCFNETCNKVADKNSTIEEWSAAFNVYNQSLDFNDDNRVDGIDYVFWLREGKSL